MGRTAPLTSKPCILYIYSTNIGTEYFKHALYCPFFSLQNAVCFIMLTCLVPVLFTFYIQSVLKLKNNNSGAKGLTNLMHKVCFTVNLFHASTCFEHHVLIVRRSKLYYTATVVLYNKFSASSWLITKINILRCTVSKTLKNKKKNRCRVFFRQLYALLLILAELSMCLLN